MPEAFFGKPEQEVWDRVTQFMREAGTLQQSLVLPLSRYCELSVLWDKVSRLEGLEKTRGYTMLARPIAKLEDVLGLHPVGMKTLAGKRGEVKENPLDKFRKQMG